jgi:hypothetical protein
VKGNKGLLGQKLGLFAMPPPLIEISKIHPV